MHPSLATTGARDVPVPVPECPICRAASSVSLSGQQLYATDTGFAPSFVFRCSACDFGFRRFAGDPPPPLDTHFRAAWYSAEDAEERLRNLRSGFYRYLLQLLPPESTGGRLLDVGCGFGHFLKIARDQGFHACGVEIDERFAARAAARSGCPVTGGGLFEVRAAPASFDIITFIDSFYYFDRPLQVLSWCRKMLRPDGWLLMRVTNRNPLARLHALMSRLNGRHATGDLPQWTTDDAISCHSRRSLTRALAATGFRVTHLTGREKGKRPRPGVRALGLTMTQALDRLSWGRIGLTSGLILLAQSARTAMPRRARSTPGVFA